MQAGFQPSALSRTRTRTCIYISFLTAPRGPAFAMLTSVAIRVSKEGKRKSKKKEGGGKDGETGLKEQEINHVKIMTQSITYLQNPHGSVGLIVHVRLPLYTCTCTCTCSPRRSCSLAAVVVVMTVSCKSMTVLAQARRRAPNCSRSLYCMYDDTCTASASVVPPPPAGYNRVRVFCQQLGRTDGRGKSKQANQAPGRHTHHVVHDQGSARAAFSHVCFFFFLSPRAGLTAPLLRSFFLLCFCLYYIPQSCPSAACFVPDGAWRT